MAKGFKSPNGLAQPVNCMLCVSASNRAQTFALSVPRRLFVSYAIWSLLHSFTERVGKEIVLIIFKRTTLFSVFSKRFWQ